MNIFFIQANRYASGYYRIGHIAKELQKYPDVNVDYYNRDDDPENFLLRIAQADIVVMQLQYNPMIEEIIPVCKQNGIQVVMDMDDDLLNVPPWNPAYFNFGRKYLSYMQTKDGQHMNIKKNKAQIKHMKNILRSVDLITVTGDGLRNEYSQFNKMKVLPNSISPEDITPQKKRWFKDDKVRIFWQGSSTHLKDMFDIKEAIQIITDRYPQVQWVIWGNMYDNFATSMGIPDNRVELKKSVNFEDYYEAFNKIDADIGICPLSDGEYNECKSNLKWVEYSAKKIPSVVSSISTYKALEDAVTGYRASSIQGWVDKLSMLIESPELRSVIAQQAHQHILQEYNIHTNIEMWYDTYVKLHESNPNKI